MDQLNVIGVVALSLPLTIIMIITLLLGLIAILIPIMYCLGFVLGKMRANLLFVLLLSCFMVLIGFTVDPYGLGLGSWELAIMLETVTLILGYSITRVYLR